MISCNRVIIILLTAYLVYLLFLRTKRNNESFVAIPLSTNFDNVAFTNEIGDIQAVNKNAVFTKGMIMAWSGSLTALPTGWVLCDGKNETPDLRGRFILGGTYGQSMTDSNDRGGANLAIGEAKGERNNTLTVDELPAHTHSVEWTCFGQDYRGGWDSDTRIVSSGGDVCSNYGGQRKVTESTGKNKPHNNMPPYYVLAFIMKL